MSTRMQETVRRRIDKYLDEEILPQMPGMALAYPQLFWTADQAQPLWPFHSYIQQDKEEFRKLCYFMLDHGIRSYLEVGIHTGVQARLLHEIFQFEKIAIANKNEIYFPVLPSESKPRTIRADGAFDRVSEFYIGDFPKEFDIFIGDSQSASYAHWRKSLGHFDLTFIDADHRYHGVKKDFEQNTVDVPYRFIAFHDIGHYAEGALEVKKLWDELPGNKLEFRSYRTPPAHMGIGIFGG